MTFNLEEESIEFKVLVNTCPKCSSSLETKDLLKLEWGDWETHKYCKSCNKTYVLNVSTSLSGKLILDVRELKKEKQK